MKRYDAELVVGLLVFFEKNEKGKLIKATKLNGKKKEILDAYKKHKQIEKDTGPKPLTPSKKNL